MSFRGGGCAALSPDHPCEVAFHPATVYPVVTGAGFTRPTPFKLRGRKGKGTNTVDRRQAMWFMVADVDAEEL